MKKNLLTSLVLFLFVLFFSCFKTNAQFLSDSSQTYFVCNATGSQLTVSAFGDSNGGTYSFWIDQRNGSAGTAIYGQHMDSLGLPQWPANGKFFYQVNSKAIWNMKAIAWQTGILITWVQGGFGVGGDTLFCNYYDLNGVSQWAQPTLVAQKQGPAVIYVGYDNLDVYPNDSGATVVFNLSPSGGNNYFSFNRIDFSGNLHWPVNANNYQGNGYYYHSAHDNHNGFYVATSTGGLGAHIYVGHFDLQGNLTITTPVDITGTAGGRNNSQWVVLCDNDTNAYVVWASYTNLDISISKITPDGTMPWGNAKQICAASGYQETPDAIIKNDTIYAIWDDGRPGANNYFIYMQKVDTAGNMLWTPDGIQLSNLTSYIPTPKLVASGNNIFATYLVSSVFRAQQIRPDSSTVWYQNGIVINVPNLPFYGDYQLVPSPSGNVTAIWRENSDNICAARLQPNGILTNISELNKNAAGLFPNPASDNFTIHLDKKSVRNVSVSIYSPMGELIFQKNNIETGTGLLNVNTADFAAGIYLVKVTAPGYNYSDRICIAR